VTKFGSDFVGTFEAFSTLGNDFLNVKTQADERWNSLNSQWTSINERYKVLVYPLLDVTKKPDVMRAMQQVTVSIAKLMSDRKTLIGATQLAVTTMFQQAPVPSAGAITTEALKQTQRYSATTPKPFPKEMTAQQIADQSGLSSVELLVSANSTIDWQNRDGSERIIIPQVTTVDAVIQSGNLVYDVNPGGTDVQFNADGYVVVSANGDVATLAGYENIIQALDRRLNTEVGALPYDDTFGIGLNSVVGEVGADERREILRSRLSDSILVDPRVKTIKSMSLTAPASDAIKINSTIELKNGDILQYYLKINNRDLAGLVG
jgi:hypothetical protein